MTTESTCVHAQRRHPQQMVAVTPVRQRHVLPRDEPDRCARSVLPGAFAHIPVWPSEEPGHAPASAHSQYLPLQRKLAVGLANDPLEAQADVLAEQALRGGVSMRTAAEAPALRRTGTTRVAPVEAPPLVHTVLGTAGVPLDAEARAFMEPRFGRDFGAVRIHTDHQAAASARVIGASAYTVGQHIVFAAGSYTPGTDDGKRLLAHELAHTLQQDAGTAAARRDVVRCRRVPNATTLAATLPAGGTDLAAHEAGLVRLLHSAWRELTPANRLKVRTDAAAFGIAGPTEAILFAALAAGSRDQILQFAQAMRAADPSVTLGDPRLIDIGARPATPDTANIAKLVQGADKIFDAVASGARNTDLSDIFGPSHVAAARAKFARGRAAMHRLQTARKIVTDRSGYNEEVELGGLTNSSQIALASSNIDNPTQADSISTMVHESMHAGNASVTDLGYIGSNSFTEMTAADKLDNAADYEVIANRILTPTAAAAFPGKKFVPAGTTVGAVTRPALTQRQSAMRQASEAYRGAWTTGLNLHTLFVREYTHPAEWNTLDLHAEFGVAAGTHFADSLPYWSKVENMTIHQRPGINAAAGAAPTSPVTQIDIAQSEGVIRKLAQGMDVATMTEPAAILLESKASAAQKTEMAKGAVEEGKVLVSLIRSEKVGEITGRVERDERVIARLVQADKAANFFDDVLAPKSPSTFAN